MADFLHMTQHCNEDNRCFFFLAALLINAYEKLFFCGGVVSLFVVRSDIMSCYFDHCTCHLFVFCVLLVHMYLRLVGASTKFLVKRVNKSKLLHD